MCDFKDQKNDRWVQKNAVHKRMALDGTGTEKSQVCSNLDQTVNKRFTSNLCGSFNIVNTFVQNPVFGLHFLMKNVQYPNLHVMFRSARTLL